MILALHLGLPKNTHHVCFHSKSLLQKLDVLNQFAIWFVANAFLIFLHLLLNLLVYIHLQNSLWFIFPLLAANVALLLVLHRVLILLTFLKSALLSFQSAAESWTPSSWRRLFQLRSLCSHLECLPIIAGCFTLYKITFLWLYHIFANAVIFIFIEVNMCYFKF